MQQKIDASYNQNPPRYAGMDVGLPLPSCYIGYADLFFYRIAYVIGKPLNRWGVSPNQITFFGLFCQCITTFSIIFDKPYFIWSMFMACVADTLDGFNARRYNKGSKYGALIDHTTDWVCGVMIFLATTFRWYTHFIYYPIVIGFTVLQIRSIKYSGCIQQYSGKTDIALSRIFQHSHSNSNIIREQLIKLREYNSSTITLIMISVFYYLQNYHSLVVELCESYYNMTTVGISHIA